VLPTLLNIPLFPLQTLLMPEGSLPLHIFEARHLHMVEKCNRLHLPFGVTPLVQGSEVQRPAGPAKRFYSIGVLAKIAELQTVQTGLTVLQCESMRRFQIAYGKKQYQGLWSANIELIPDDAATVIPQDLQQSVALLSQSIEALRKQDASNPWLPSPRAQRLADCGWVANRWCELLPLPLTEKHNLMALESPLLRLELIPDILAHTQFPDTPYF
jgi:Lon protease-like protein